MKTLARWSAVAVLTAGSLAAASLFSGAAQSTWSVSDGKNVVGSATMTTDGKRVRVDWMTTSGGLSTFVAVDGKIWVKGTSGDADFSTYKDATGRALVPALLLPVTTTPSDSVATNGSKVSSYTYSGSSASYTYDAKGPLKIEVTQGSKKFTLTRLAINTATGNENSYYEVKGKTSRLAGLKGMAGGILGGSDNSVSASAGVKGVDDKTALKDGIDQVAVRSLMDKDDKAKSTRVAELKKFQKEGKVGGGQ